MTPLRCPRELELSDAMSSGRWPHACDDELRNHVAACEGCLELEAVAGAFLEDRRAGESEAHVPSAGAVWWRMQLRAEREARVTAERTVRGTHSAIVGAIVVALLVVLAMTPLLHRSWSGFWTSIASGELLRTMSSAVPPMTMLLVALVPLLLFAPVALYFAFSKD